MNDAPATAPTQPAPPAEIRLPWYVIVGGMIIITAIIMFTFAKPLDTTPPAQPAASAAEAPR